MNTYTVNKWFLCLFWCTAIVIIAPTLIVIFGYNDFYSMVAPKNLLNYPFFGGLGLLFSIPTFIIVFIVWRLLTLKNLSAIIIKPVLCLTAIAGVVATDFLAFDSMRNTVPLTYSAGFVVSCLFYKIYNKDTA